MNRMSIDIVERNEQALSNFISTSPWDDTPLLEAIGPQAYPQLSVSQPQADKGLILDESGVGQARHGFGGGGASVLWLIRQNR